MEGEVLLVEVTPLFPGQCAVRVEEYNKFRLKPSHGGSLRTLA